MDTKPTILQNVDTSAGHWLTLQLIGDVSKKVSRDAIGAIVYLTTGKVRQRRDVISGNSYASQNDLALHFGLGSATAVDKIQIKWPDGSTQTVNAPGVDRKITVAQDKGIIK